MASRTFAAITLLVGALISFGLAVWVGFQGGFPLLETAHAILFGLLALVLMSENGRVSLCRECSMPEGGLDFCLGCGRTKVAS